MADRLWSGPAKVYASGLGGKEGGRRMFMVSRQGKLCVPGIKAGGRDLSIIHGMITVLELGQK